MLNELKPGLLCLFTVTFLYACAGESVLSPVISTIKNGVFERPVLMKASAPISSGAGFINLASDRRIAYEPGGKALALKVKRHLNDKAAIIQQRQYAPFNKPIAVYVLNSKDSAKRYCASEMARGCVVNQRLFVTKRAKASLPSLLLHELSHLHFEQKLGMYRYHSEVPAWFQEGLAVFVSDGAGAEKVTFTYAIIMLRSDKSIMPNATRSLLSPKRAAQFGMRNSMFYAQSGIFVKYLHQQSPQKFRKLVLSIANGNPFAQSLRAIYAKPLSEIWSDFKNEIKGNDIESLRRYNIGSNR